VVDRTKGVTLSFKNDPLDSVLVSSTFDSLPSVQKFLQQAIENQLRQVFAEDLPGIIHEMSLKYINGEKNTRPPKHNDQAHLGRSLYTKEGNVEGFQRGRVESFAFHPPENQESEGELNARLAVSLPDLHRYQEEHQRTDGANWSVEERAVNDRRETRGRSPSPTQSKWRGNEGNLKLEFDAEARAKLTKSLSLLNLNRVGGLRQVVEQEPHLSAQVHYRSSPSVHGLDSSSIKSSPPIISGHPFSASSFLTNSPIGVRQQMLNATLAGKHHDSPHRSLYQSPSASRPTALYFNQPSSPTGDSEYPNSPRSELADEFHSLTNSSSPTSPNQIVLEPVHNSMTAHLGHLMNANHTMSPYTRVVEHFALRSFPHSTKVSSRHRRRLPWGGRLRRNVVKLQFGDNKENTSTM
jgi:distribution and morphology protein 34